MTNASALVIAEAELHPGEQLIWAERPGSHAMARRVTVTATEVGKAARELGLIVKDARPTPGARAAKCIMDQDVRELVPGTWVD